MPRKVCKVCVRSQSVTGPAPPPVSHKENDADDSGEAKPNEADGPGETITVKPQNDNEILKTPVKKKEDNEFLSPEPVNT